MPARCPELPAVELSTQPARHTLADIFRLYGDVFRAEHPLPYTHLKAMQDIRHCRTAVLGGHLHVCDACGYEHPVYNSCGNRHCPQCQHMAKTKWLEARVAELLPAPYFHTVFTLPHILNPIARCNKKRIYDILFSSVSKTLLSFGINPKNGIGGNIGFITILHTWDQKLLEHIHLHCVIPAGAISPDRTQWIHPRHPDFLFPVHALSAVFRGKFMDEFKKSFNQNNLSFHGTSKNLQSHAAFQSMIQTLYKTKWVVYAKKPFAGPKYVLNYLSRYTHKIALSNNRIKAIHHDSVTFSYRDRKHNNALKEMTLPAHQFISRFLRHILPKSFTRIRHYGFLSNRDRSKHISLARQLLNMPLPDDQSTDTSTQQRILTLTGIDVSKCPRCTSGTMRFARSLPKLTLFTRDTYYHKPQILDSS